MEYKMCVDEFVFQEQVENVFNMLVVLFQSDKF